MARACRFRPNVTILEDRAVPGSVLTRPDLATALGPTLALALDLSGEAIAVASYEAQTHGKPGHAAGGLSGSPAAPLAVLPPVQSPLQSLGDNDGGNGGGAPPPSGLVVQMGFLPGSFIQIGTNSPITFGNDPPIDGVDNVHVLPDGTMLASQADFHIRSAEFMFSGYTFDVQLRPQSDLSGTFDPTTGNSTASIAIDVKITSPDAPNFNNDTCIIPATQLNLTTDAGVPFRLQTAHNPQGVPRDVGTVVDNTFAAPAIPMGACGQIAFVDYATVINNQFGLPSDAGNNTFALAVSITPPVGFLVPPITDVQPVSGP